MVSLLAELVAPVLVALGVGYLFGYLRFGWRRRRVTEAELETIVSERTTLAQAVLDIRGTTETEKTPLERERVGRDAVAVNDSQTPAALRTGGVTTTWSHREPSAPAEGRPRWLDAAARLDGGAGPQSLLETDAPGETTPSSDDVVRSESTSEEAGSAIESGTAFESGAASASGRAFESSEMEESDLAHEALRSDSHSPDPAVADLLERLHGVKGPAPRRESKVASIQLDQLQLDIEEARRFLQQSRGESSPSG